VILDPLSLQCLIHPCLLCFSACAGVIKEVVDTHKLREKLAMLVTDNAANMVLARRLVVESDGFKHILQMRWVGGWVVVWCCFVLCGAVPVCTASAALRKALAVAHVQLILFTSE
jgi:hypothetical protein